MTNLLQETLEYIESDPDFTISDITFIGINGGGAEITWDEFKELADFEYDSGYGTHEVIPNLIIELENELGRGFMYRHEYDGAEWWAMVYRSNRPNNDTITTLKADTY